MNRRDKLIGVGLLMLYIIGLVSIMRYSTQHGYSVKPICTCERSR